MRVRIPPPAQNRIMEIGEIVRQFREKQGMNVKDFAEKVGLTEHTIHRIEKGERSPKFSTVGKIFRTFDYDMTIKLFKTKP